MMTDLHYDHGHVRRHLHASGCDDHEVLNELYYCNSYLLDYGYGSLFYFASIDYLNIHLVLAENPEV